MKKKITLLLYGLALITVWGSCFLDAQKANAYTAAMGLSFTFLSVYFLQKERNFDLKTADKLLTILLPAVYLIVFYATSYERFYNKFGHDRYYAFFYIHIVNPINIGVLFLLLGLTKLKDLARPANLFVFSFLTLFYTVFLFGDWRAQDVKSLTENFDPTPRKTAETDSPTDSTLNLTLDLSGFSFIGKSLDTIALTGRSDRYILLETWNETCPPCIRAMKELPDFYQSIGHKADVYYVYESGSANARQQFDRIFNFQSIHDKERIVVDIGMDLYKALNMRGYPYFLLFDKEGRLVFHARGYAGKAELSRRIMEHLD